MEVPLTYSDIMAAVKMARAADVAEMGQFTIGSLIEELKKYDPMASVNLPFYGCTLNGQVGSYRGYYDELALGVSAEYGEKTPTARELILILGNCIGKEFLGWKGGAYKMTLDTPVWIANPGNGGSPIVGVRCKYASKPEWLELVTREDED